MFSFLRLPCSPAEKLSILSILSILSLPLFDDIGVEEDGMGLGAWGMEKE